MQPQPQLRVGAKTHPGKVRTENQDRMSRSQSPIGEVFIVADGMGGHQGGATAAAMTNDGFASHLTSALPGSLPEAALQEAARTTNAEIYNQANSGNPATARMGATVVLAVVNGPRMLVAHAGDSRAYLFRNGKLIRLTKDHSAVQQMIDHNMITEEEARDHPDSSVINRAFGQKPEIDLEISQTHTIQPGDGLLLCTDGLCGYVDDAEIARVINSYEEPQDVTDALINLALDAGGEDNVTVQFLQFGQRLKVRAGAPLEGGQPRRTPVIAPTPVKPLKWWQHNYVEYVFWVVAAASLLLIAYSLGQWMRSRSQTPSGTTLPASPTPKDASPQPRDQRGYQAPLPTPTNSIGGSIVPQQPSPQPTPSASPSVSPPPTPEKRNSGSTSGDPNKQPKQSSQTQGSSGSTIKEIGDKVGEAIKGALPGTQAGDDKPPAKPQEPAAKGAQGAAPKKSGPGATPKKDDDKQKTDKNDLE